MNLEVLKGHRRLQNLDGYHFHAARKIFPSFLYMELGFHLVVIREHSGSVVERLQAFPGSLRCGP